MTRTALLLALLLLCAACATPETRPDETRPDALEAPSPSADPVDAPAMTVTPFADLKWSPLDPSNPNGLQVSLVLGDMQKGPVTFFLKLPPGSKSPIHGHSNDYHSVVIQGAPTHAKSDKEPQTPLAVGSTWFQPGQALHFDSCTGDQDCIILLQYPTGGFDFFMAPQEAPAAE